MLIPLINKLFLFDESQNFIKVPLKTDDIYRSEGFIFRS